ncbi:MAG: hypothetical protein MUF86_05480 [Akkermansiaceae bacterium]|jgi:hypothetical protein|nr:hypothetical protein [Akkermansiaceae bacterium]
MKTGTITRTDLVDRAGVVRRTILRLEKKLGLSRIPCGGRQVIYQFTGTEEELIRQIKAPYRRPGNMRLSLVPDPAFVRREITRVCGPQMKTTISGCLLSLSRLAEMALILDGDAAIQINAARHQKLVGSHHHKKILSILSETRLIEKVGGYEAGKHCNSYRLVDAAMAQLEEQQLWWPTVNNSEEKPVSIEDLIDDAKCPHNPGVLSRLMEDSRAFSFSDDLDMEAVVAEQAADAMKKALTKRPKLSTQAREAIVRRSRFACIVAHRRYIENPLSLFRVGMESQRLFHPIAMMPRRLRAKLHCMGEHVTTLDICCCQPFLLGLILMEDRETGEIPQAELDRFMDLCQRGKFYDYLGQRCSPKRAREESKTLCYRDLFFGHPHSNRTPIVEVFNQEFPAMGGVLRRLRSSSRSLSGELQRSEAWLIIGRVLPALQEAFPCHPITIVHDAVLVPRSISAQAMKMMGRTVRHATGKQAGIKVETP